MATYLELKAQAEKLLAQAEQMKEQERADVIADVKSKIAAYDLSADDLGLSGGRGGSGGRGRTAKAKKAPAAIKYRGPNGETWSGGRGRKPQWVVTALAKGKSLDEFRV